MNTDEQVDEFLEHFGVSGMKWGQRKAGRAMNKASRQKDNAKAVASIDKARARFDSGKIKTERKAAKAQFKKDKVDLGSREARKILNKTKDKHYRDYQTATQYKNGKEVAKSLLITAGVVMVASVVSKS